MAVAACLVLANCASSGKFASSASIPDMAFPIKPGGWWRSVTPCRRAVAPTASANPIPSAGRIYVPKRTSTIAEEGLASWYGDDFHGRLTANGRGLRHGFAYRGASDPADAVLCAGNHSSNGKSLIVRVNDRGPYHGNRLIDVSNKAAELLEFKGNGVARVRVEYVARAPLEGSDDRQLMATLRTGIPAPSPSLVRVASARPFVPEMSSHGPADPRRGSDAGGAALRTRQHTCRHGLDQRHLGNVRFGAAASGRPGARKIRAPSPMKAMAVTPRTSTRFRPTNRSTGAVPANCWPAAASTEFPSGNGSGPR